MTNTHLVLGIKVIQQGHWATQAVSCGKLIDPILKCLLIFLVKKKKKQSNMEEKICLHFQTETLEI